MDILVCEKNADRMLFTPAGEEHPIYFVDCPIGLSSDLERATVYKVDKFLESHLVGCIELSTYLNDLVLVDGREITPHRKNRFR
jgi:hypothetical protein